MYTNLTTQVIRIFNVNKPIAAILNFLTDRLVGIVGRVARIDNDFAIDFG